MSGGDDYPEAAGKHLADASTLLDGARYDGAAHLAGYVVECALKTLIQMETRRTRRSHDLASLSSTLGAIAAQASFRTQRVYVSAAAFLHGSRIVAWKPEMRYRAAQVTRSTARAWFREAQEFYRLTIGRLRDDGVI